MIAALPSRLRATIAYRTDVQTSHDGSEVRASTLTVPRGSYAATFQLLDDDIRTVEQVMAATAAGAYELPLAHEAVAALAPITSTAVSVTATYADWIAVGRRVLVVGPASSYAAEITAATGGALTLDASPPSTYPAGVTHVYPLESVLLNDGAQGKRWPVAAGEWSFDARAATPRAAGGAGATLTTFGGLTVIDRRPIGDSAGTQTIGGVRWIDVGGSATSVTAWERSRQRRDGRWRLATPAVRQWAKALIGAARGRRTRLLRPTWRPDLTLYQAPTAGANTIRVAQNFVGLWGDDLARQRLQLEYADGSVGYFAISSATWNGVYAQLTLGASLPGSIPGGSVRVVSFLESVRLDDDAASLEYNGADGWAGYLALTTITIQE